MILLLLSFQFECAGQVAEVVSIGRECVADLLDLPFNGNRFVENDETYLFDGFILSISSSVVNNKRMINIQIELYE